jgi:hypothetical protein
VARAEVLPGAFGQAAQCRSVILAGGVGAETVISQSSRPVSIVQMSASLNLLHLSL